MGTARLERELTDQAQDDLRRREAQQAQSEIDEAETRLRGKLKEIEMELQALGRRKTEAAADARALETSQALRSRRILERRGPGDGRDVVAEQS